jgi:hypothetical protein
MLHRQFAGRQDTVKRIEAYQARPGRLHKQPRGDHVIHKSRKTVRETDQDETEVRTRDDVNEEQVSTTPVVQVETAPVKPDDEARPSRIPGVSSS